MSSLRNILKQEERECSKSECNKEQKSGSLFEAQTEFHQTSLFESQDEFFKASTAKFESIKEHKSGSLVETQDEFFKASMAKFENIKKQKSGSLFEAHDEFFKASMAKFENIKKQKSGSLFEAHDELSKASLFESPMELRASMRQMEAFYTEKLKNARFETAKKEEELKSLKDSLAAQVAASLTTGDTESMNNPVSKTRLTEMYDNLKLLQWPKVKNQLKSRMMNPKEAKDLIQKTFRNASDEMKRRRQQIEEMFQLSESSSEPTPQKVKEYRQLAVQNLQMALFHTNKEELRKTGFPEYLDEFPEEVKEDLRPLTSECYWLSCLMALNNPPLQPDWKNHVPGFDSWDIFPREIKPSVM